MGVEGVALTGGQTGTDNDDKERKGRDYTNGYIPPQLCLLLVIVYIIMIRGRKQKISDHTISWCRLYMIWECGYESCYSNRITILTMSELACRITLNEYSSSNLSWLPSTMVVPCSNRWPMGIGFDSIHPTTHLQLITFSFSRANWHLSIGTKEDWSVACGFQKYKSIFSYSLLTTIESWYNQDERYKINLKKNTNWER